MRDVLQVVLMHAMLTLILSEPQYCTYNRHMYERCSTSSVDACSAYSDSDTHHNTVLTTGMS